MARGEMPILPSELTLLPVFDLYPLPTILVAALTLSFQVPQSPRPFNFYVIGTTAGLRFHVRCSHKFSEALPLPRL